MLNESFFIYPLTPSNLYIEYLFCFFLSDSIFHLVLSCFRIIFFLFWTLLLFYFYIFSFFSPKVFVYSEFCFHSFCFFPSVPLIFISYLCFYISNTKPLGCISFLTSISYSFNKYFSTLIYCIHYIYRLLELHLFVRFLINVFVTCFVCVGHGSFVLLSLPGPNPLHLYSLISTCAMDCRRPMAL
jgi:hypothetical protein